MNYKPHILDVRKIELCLTCGFGDYATQSNKN